MAQLPHSIHPQSTIEQVLQHIALALHRLVGHIELGPVGLEPIGLERVELALAELGPIALGLVELAAEPSFVVVVEQLAFVPFVE